MLDIVRYNKPKMAQGQVEQSNYREEAHDPSKIRKEKLSVCGVKGEWRHHFFFVGMTSAAWRRNIGERAREKRKERKLFEY